MLLFLDFRHILEHLMEAPGAAPAQIVPGACLVMVVLVLVLELGVLVDPVPPHPVLLMVWVSPAGQGLRAHRSTQEGLAAPVGQATISQGGGPGDFYHSLGQIQAVAQAG